jgi:hypothetical protein
MYEVKFQNKDLDGVIPDVVEDGLVEQFPHRWFLDSGGQRTEVPIAGTVFVFGPERHEMITKRHAELEAAKQKSEAQPPP